MKPAPQKPSFANEETWGDSMLKWTIVICAGISLLVMITGICVSIYRKIRYGSLWPVNCWFCNISSKVPYALRNSWTCDSCQQYNGFTQNGGYNKRIAAQYLQALNPPVVPRGVYQKGSKEKKFESSGNGLCAQCNLNQELKIFQLASFVPSSEANFDKEIDNERNKLEKIYDLCGSCKKILKAKLAKKINDIDKNDAQHVTRNGLKKGQGGWKGKVLSLSLSQEAKANDTFDAQSQSSDSSKGTFYSTASSDQATRASSSVTMEEGRLVNDFDEVASLDRLSLGFPTRRPTSPHLLSNVCSNCAKPNQHILRSNPAPSASSVWRDYPSIYNNSHLLFGRTVAPSVCSYGSHSHLQVPQSNFYRSSSVANIFGGKSLLAPSRFSLGSPASLNLNGYGASTSTGWGVGLYYHNCFGPLPSPNIYSPLGTSWNLFNSHLSRASSQSSGFISQGLHTPSPRPPMSTVGSEASRPLSAFSMRDNSFANGSREFQPYDGQEYEAHLYFQNPKKTEPKLTRARSNECSRFGPSRPNRTGFIERRSPRLVKANAKPVDKSCYYSSDSEDDGVDQETTTMPKRSPSASQKMGTRGASASPTQRESDITQETPCQMREPSIPLEGQAHTRSPLAWKRLFYYTFAAVSLLLNLVFVARLMFGLEMQTLSTRVSEFVVSDFLHDFSFDFFQWMRRISHNVSACVKHNLLF